MRRLVCIGVIATGLLLQQACSTSSAPVTTYPNELTYSATHYFPGIDETVTIRKDPDRVVVIRASGAEQSLPSILAAEVDARRARYGNLDPAFAHDLATLAQTALADVAVHFEVPLAWDVIAARLQAEGTHGDALAELVAAIDRVAVPLEASMRRQGFTSVHHVPTLPIIFATGMAADITALARRDGITLVADARPRVGRNDLVSPSDMIDIHQIDSVLNNHVPGYYGTGQRLGIVQLMQPNAAIFDTHEAFSQNGTVTYQSGVIQSCSTTNDCNPGCTPYTCKTDNHELPPPPTCSNTSICVNGRCVDTHASEVLSSATATQGGNPWGAARAALFVANGSPNACSTADLASAFNFFVTQVPPVATVIEPFECGWPPAQFPGVEDYYSRVFGTTVFVSSGDNGSGGSISGQYACPQTFNGICVGATDHSFGVASYSNVKNPVDLGNVATDREEPDVVGLGGGGGSACATFDGVHVVGFNSNTDWGSVTAGTSLSVGVVAGMNVVLREACAGVGLFQNELSSRAIMRTAAWDVTVTPTNWRYSTPSTGHDWTYGGGFVTASDAFAFCQPGPGPHTTSQVTTINLGAPGPNPPSVRNYGYTPGGVPPQNGQLHTEDHSIPPNGGADGRDYIALFAANFPSGGRIRFTMSWDACALSANNWEPIPVQPDFDLFLYNSSTQGFLYGSQSTQDNNEGFDVTISAANAGNYSVYAAWPHLATGCGGTSLPSVGWAAAWWN